jgi:hypothetical protein
MPDLATLSALASSAVALLAPYLAKAAEGAAEHVGQSAIGALWAKLTQKTSHPGTQEALQDLAEQPTDADTQASLRKQLQKALAADPVLATELAKWLQDAQAHSPSPSITQTANVHGNQNTVMQIAGSGNTVR